LTGAALAHGATAHEAVTTDPNLETRVVELGELPGFWAANCPIALSSATAWAQSDSTEATALQSEGFAAGVRELLRSSSGELGVSVGLQFRSASGARADLERREQLAGRDGYATSFPVPGAPSVRGYSVESAGSTTVHVAFSRGAEEYAVAVGAANGTNLGALERTLVTAVARDAGRR
jgi:hypothetical protein